MTKVTLAGCLKVKMCVITRNQCYGKYLHVLAVHLYLSFYYYLEIYELLFYQGLQILFQKLNGKNKFINKN